MFDKVRDDAAEIIIKQLEAVKKKIPQRGLNNISRAFLTEGKPTLVKRMDNLLWHTLYLPPQMVATGVSSDSFDKPRAAQLVNEVMTLLIDLQRNLDTVTVVEQVTVQSWKRSLQNRVVYVQKAAVIMGVMIEAEFKVVE